MKKEGSRNSFLFEKEGKLNLALILSIFVLFVVMSFCVYATITITQSSPTDNAVNGSNKINFTFTPVWDGTDDVVGNCTIWTNVTGTWLATKENETNATFSVILNNSLSWINYSFDRDNVIAWAVRCTNNTATGGDKFSTNRTLTIDTTAPTVIADTPKGLLISNAQTNFTAYPLKLMVNISDNTTSFVWYVLNSAQNGAGTNESVNRTMTFERDAAGGGALYNATLDGILNFSSTYTGPGPHSIFFCANDSLDRETCAGPYDYIIKGMNVSEMERQFAEEIQHPDAGFTFSGMDIRYGNGSDVPFGTFMNPTSGNFTFNMNFSGDVGVFVVGGRIDENQFANASRTEYKANTTLEARQAAGTGFESNLTWFDISSFIPSEVSYEYGIIQMPATYSKVMYCNGTSPTDPGCFGIDECNGTAIGLFNYSEIIPPNSACWLTSGEWGEQNASEQGPANVLSSGFTYIFVDHFSGGLGANDFSQPSVTYNTPSLAVTNSSSVLTQIINFTIEDINSTGLNLTKNNSMNLTITLGGSTIAFFNFTNSTETRLSCGTSDTVSIENTTSVTCNVTYNFNSNGTYVITVTGRDTSNNTNPVNITGSSITIIIDQILPVIDYLNVTHNATYDLPEINVTSLGTSAGTSSAQGKTIYIVTNSSDNLTQVDYGVLQFLNGSSWQTLNETLAFQPAYNSSSFLNFSYPILAEHNSFEGKNVTFRVLVNDTQDNQNNRSFTIQINDTTAPQLLVSSVAGGTAINGTNTTDTTPTIVWNVTEGSGLKYIAIQVDSSTSTTCNLFRNYSSITEANANRNGSMTVLGKSDNAGCSDLTNGTRTVRLTTEDTWGNSELYIHSFTVETGGPDITLSSLENGLSAVNQSNVTPYTGINFTAVNGGTGGIKNLTFTSSCNSTVQEFVPGETPTIQNLSFIWPFNYTGCKGAEANRTVTITVYDFAGNSQTKLYQFLVDDLGPTLTVNTPTNGFSGANNITINLSAQDGSQKISRFGYFLDGGELVDLINLNSSSAIGAAATSITNVFSVNFTPGTHTIKFTASDALGTVTNNSVNSSVITFTATGPIQPAQINNSMNTYITTLLTFPSNVTVKLRDSVGNYNEIGSANESDVSGTFEIVLSLNNSAAANEINVTLTEINGSAANWDKINISVFINESKVEAGIQNNWTNSILDFVMFNDSVEEFIAYNNSYYGAVLLNKSINLTNASRSTVQEFWWLPDETNLQSRENISQCTTAFNATRTTPCWNLTADGRTLIQVPHFSIVVAVNDTTAPTITVNTPSSAEGNQTVSMFDPNITVSSDTISCKYSVNRIEGTTNKTMAKTGTSCIGDTERFKNNGTGIYNLTFYAMDSAGNEATLVFTLNISDTTAPNSGIISASAGTTTATITISNVNESVNVTVWYGTSNTSLSSSATETDFNKTQTVSITGLTEGTTYYYNVTLSDYNGNTKRNDTLFSFTTSTAATTTTTTTTTGGGPAAAVPSTNILASKSKMWLSVAAGSSLTLAVDKADIAITEINVKIANSLSNVELKASSLKDNPVPTAAADKVYQYLQITKKNILDSDADEIKIKFRVTKSWLSDNSLTEENIALYRYKDDKWNMLSTAVTGSDATYVNYEAITPGFSYFAIGSKEAPPEEAPEEIPQEEAPPAEAPEEEAPPELPPPAERKLPIAWIIFLAIILVGLIAYLIVMRKKQEY
jgi:PGF-pre-PGF domain-containing protein